MKKYKYRGYDWLIAEILVFVLGLICFLVFEYDEADSIRTYLRCYGLVLMTVSFLIFLPRFIFFRKLTPEQFEKHLKKEKQDFDERSFQIGCRACRIAEVAGELSLCAGLIVFAFVFPNKVALWATIGYLTVMILTMLIAHAVYSSKM